ncbi:BTB/POZ and TAZ domain-containing protein 1 [Lactuca sativa]|nr:BTB/POZ and TAZ domain-containing protein 1 [Lactuca sativa]
MEKFGIHLLVLSHVYLVPQLKSRCSKALIEWLTIENMVDVLQLVRLCNAPDLHFKCVKLVSNIFKAIEKTEGWKFLQPNDPFLKLEILQVIDESESRSKKRRKEQNLYLQLSEGMDCLEHICTEGCISVGPCNKEPTKSMYLCSNCQHVKACNSRFNTCHIIRKE